MPEPCTPDLLRQLLRRFGAGATFQVVATTPNTEPCFDDADAEVATRMFAYATRDDLRLMFTRARWQHVGFGPRSLMGFGIATHTVVVSTVAFDGGDTAIVYEPGFAYLLSAKPSEGACSDEARIGLSRAYLSELREAEGTPIRVSEHDESPRTAAFPDDPAPSVAPEPPEPPEPVAMLGTYLVMRVSKNLRTSGTYGLGPWRDEGALVVDPAGELHICPGHEDSWLEPQNGMQYAAEKTMEIMTAEEFLWSLYERSNLFTTYCRPVAVEVSSVEEALARVGTGGALLPPL